MSFFEEVLRVLIEHWECAIPIAVALVGALKLTSWGKNKGQALDVVVRIIETLGLSEAKSLVASQQIALPHGVNDAIEFAVAKADPKKQPPSWTTLLFREAFRGFLAEKTVTRQTRN